MGAWIEIETINVAGTQESVAPHMGAWIEITRGVVGSVVYRSLPTWERGLKFSGGIRHSAFFSRSPHGSVD